MADYKSGDIVGTYSGTAVLAGLHDVEATAKRLGIKPGTVYRYFNRGLLKKTLIGRSVFVSEQEIERFSRERKPSGNPNLQRHQ